MTRDGVNSLDEDLQLVESQAPNMISVAARIWACATAQRDQRPEPATGEEKIPGIQRRLNLEGSKLLLARRGDTYVGFTLYAPREESLEIFYLAVAPESWGSGVAGSLLLGAEEHARSIGREVLELWVISDNERALSVYAKSGFVGTERMIRDEHSGRIERQMLKQI